MKISGSMVLSATRQELWELLQTPEFLKEVMPGCRDLTQTKPDHYTGLFEARIGAVSSKYTTAFSLHDKKPRHSYRLVIKSKGKAGSIDAETHISLEEADAPNRTELQYEGEVAIGGPVALIGRRTVEAAAKTMIDRGFDTLKHKIEAHLRQS